jgi:hypothetical protein
MKRHWTPAELHEHWSLLAGERELVEEGVAGIAPAARDAHTRLGFACLLKYFQWEGRFPRSRAEVPVPALAHLAHELGVPATGFVRYDWGGRMASHHRAAVRAFLGVREATVADQQAVVAWLVAHELPQRQHPEAVRAAFLHRLQGLAGLHRGGEGGDGHGAPVGEHHRLAVQVVGAPGGGLVRTGHGRPPSAPRRCRPQPV